MSLLFSEPGKESCIAEILHARRMPESSVSDQLPLDILHMEGIMFNIKCLIPIWYHTIIITMQMWSTYQSL